MSFLKKKDKMKTSAKTTDEAIRLDIPEEEIWTYQVEGLAAPHINKPFKNFKAKKILLTLVILVAVSLSMYFSIRTVQNETFEYEKNDTGYTLTKFSNTGFIRELDIDYASSISYDEGNSDPETNFNVDKDNSIKVTSVGPYALNCDGTVKVINIGADVEYIDSKAFYSCWSLERIEVDENNPYYCDIDGVLYNKDKTVVMNYPCNHDQYLREKHGISEELNRVTSTEEYRQKIQTYVVPSTVETIGELAFAYVNLREIYLPEGLRRVETLGFFKLHEPGEWSNTPSLDNIYSYKADGVDNTALTDKEALGEIYLSLPEGLEYIASDAFSYNQVLSYLYIPESVNYIGHHAFWDTVYKEGGELKGVTEINVAADEESFRKAELGDQWRPQYDYMLFKKSVGIVYSAERAK
ncbi:MAG: leucine-rich repeat protein [Clostridia bacterium]|nr:leucine-rich repeat protein [Clostridia bacterium]